MTHEPTLTASIAPDFEPLESEYRWSVIREDHDDRNDESLDANGDRWNEGSNE